VKSSFIQIFGVPILNPNMHIILKEMNLILHSLISNWSLSNLSLKLLKVYHTFLATLAIYPMWGIGKVEEKRSPCRELDLQRIS